MVLQTTALMLIIDIFSRFDGNPGTIYPVLNYYGNFLIYLLNPVLPSFWLLYVHYQIFRDKRKSLRQLYPLLAVNAVNVFLSAVSQFFGWFYSIDSDNIYHRGPLFWIPAAITLALIFASYVLLVSNRKKIDGKYYFTLVFFAVPPLISIILQIIFYGMSLMLNAVVISILILFINIQNHSIYIDYLTGINNRKKLETHMQEKINTSTENKTFSAILIDMNNFKSINDTFGHNMGDDALETIVMLLKGCIGSNDFIARFGGDEFYIILESSNRDTLQTTVRRINDCIENYNKSDAKPYKLGLSMGYAVYDYHSHMKMEEFQKQIDILMYQNKHANGKS